MSPSDKTSEAPRRRRWRWWLWLPVSLVALVLLLPVVAVLALQLGPVRQVIIDQARQAVAPDLVLDIGAIDGFIPVDMTVRDIRLADKHGPWLSVDQVRLAWSPLDLFGGTVRVDVLGAENVDLARAPDLPPGPPPPPPDPDAPLIPELPELPVALVLESLDVGPVHLGADLAGQAATLDLAASARWQDGVIGLKADLKRTDGAGAEVTVDIAYTAADQRLKAHIHAHEPAGGMVAGLMGLADRPAVDLTLDGQGPLSDWAATLKAAAGPGVAVDLAATIGLPEQASADYRLALKGDARATPLLPAELRSALADGVDLDVAATLHGDQKVSLHHARVTAGPATVSARGGADLAAETVQADTEISVGDMAPFGAILGGDAAGSLTLTASADGPMALPSAKVRVTGTGLRLPMAAADDLTLDLDAQRRDGDRLAVDLAVDATALAAGGMALSDMFGGAVQVRLQGGVAPQPLSADIGELTIQAGPAARLRLGGRVATADDGTLNADVKLAVPALAPVAGPFGVDVTGAADLDLSAALAPDGGVTGRLDLGLSDLGTGVAAADAAVGTEARLSGPFALAADGGIHAGPLRLSSANARLDAEARMSPDQGVKADVDLTVPRLAPLLSALGLEGAGSVDLTVHAEGAMDAITATVALNGTGVSVAGTDLGDPALKLAAEGLPAAPRADLTLAAAPMGLDTNLAVRAALDGDTARVEELNLTAGPATLTGRATADLAGPSVDGQIDLKVGDLALLGRLAGTDLRGGLDLSATLTPADGQGVDLRLTGKGLGVPGVAIGGLDVTAKVRQALGDPAVSARIEMPRVDVPDTLDAKVVATAEGALSGLDVGLDVDGTLRQPRDLPLDLRLRTRLAIAQAIEVALNELRLDLADHRVALNRACTIGLDGGTTRIGDCALAIDSGSLTAGGTMGPDRVDLQLRVNDLPLALAEIAMPDQPLTGTADLRADLKGSAAAPRGDIRLQVSGFKLEVDDSDGLNPLVDLPPTGLTADVALKGGSTGVDLAVDLAGSGTLAVRGDLPLAVSMAGAEMRDRGRLDLTVRADADMARLSPLFLPATELLTGTLKLDVTAAGTPAAPRVDGQGSITGGQYQSGASGTVVRDITLDVSGTPEGLRLSVGGKDGDGGTLAAKADIDLEDLGVDASAELDDFRVARLDYAKARASGAVTAKVVVEDMTGSVEGKITVAPVSASPPSGLPPSVKTIQVTEVTTLPGPQAAEVTKPAAEAARQQTDDGGITLDITIDLPGPMTVSGRGLNSSWTGNLKVAGTATAPIITGSIDVSEGSLDVLGRTFTIDKGEIRFPGSRVPDPVLDIEASATANDITAIIKITGVASDPSIELTSSPERPSDEVLARVMFGKPLGELSTLEYVQLAKSLAALTGALGGGGDDMLGNIQEGLGLDRLSVDEDDSSGPGLTLGKDIADGVKVDVVQGLSADTSRLRVTIDVLEDVQVETEVGADNTQRLGVRYQYEFD